MYIESLIICTGDLCVIEGAGAYCAGMSAKNYNSFPEAAEVMIDTAGRMHLVRRYVH
jgi:diaminopimelate decarboxylase